MYLSVTVKNGNDKKTVGLLENLEYLNVNSETIIHLDKNNNLHIRALKEVKEQLSNILKKPFNGFVAKIAESHVRQTLNLLNQPDSEIMIEWDFLNNGAT